MVEYFCHGKNLESSHFYIRNVHSSPVYFIYMSNFDNGLVFFLFFITKNGWVTIQILIMSHPCNSIFGTQIMQQSFLISTLILFIFTMQVLTIQTWPDKSKSQQMELIELSLIMWIPKGNVNYGEIVVYRYNAT